MSGIRAKLLGYTALMILLVSVVLTSYSIFTNRSQSLDIYREDAIQIGSALSEAVLNDLYQLDMRGLRLRLGAVHQNQNVAATFILDERGHVMADGTEENPLRGRPLEDPFVPTLLTARSWVMDSDKERYKIGQPIAMEGEEPMGWLYLQLSLTELNERIERQLKDTLIISGVCILLGFVSALSFSMRFTRPITELTHAANRVRSGDTTVDIPITGQDEIRLLSVSLEEMLRQLRASEKGLRDLNVSLDQKVRDRTQELEDAFQVIHSSIQYASTIQRSILPPPEHIQRQLPHRFVVWQPRDTVGGDIYWCRTWGEGTLVILGDCTGHGVPGAFMTLIANGALGHALRSTPPGELSPLILTMHHNIQEILGQDQASEGSDDGLELGACYIPPEKQHLLFAGARFSLFFRDTGQPAEEIKGDRKGIGYRKPMKNPDFAVHTVLILPNRRFILTTDGIIDQVGGPKRQGFGKKRFLALWDAHQETPIQDLGTLFYDALCAYQGQEIRRDDVTIIGFTL